MKDLKSQWSSSPEYCAPEIWEELEYWALAMPNEAASKPGPECSSAELVVVVKLGAGWGCATPN